MIKAAKRPFFFAKHFAEKDRAKLFLSAFYGSVFSPEARMRATDALAVLGAAKGDLSDLLSPWVGKRFGDEELEDAAWRIGASLPFLREGKAVSNEVRAEGWVGGIVWELSPGGRFRGGAPFVRLSIRITDGAAAGLRIGHSFSSRYVKDVLAITLGCPKFVDKSELDVIQFRAAIKIGETPYGPRVMAFRCPSGSLAFNRRLYRARKKCVLGRGVGGTVGSCSVCHRGFVSADGCPLAVHPFTFVFSYCSFCGKRKFFDPRRSEVGNCCVACEFSRAVSGGERPFAPKEKEEGRKDVSG